MEWQDLFSIIGTYILLQICVFCSHLFAAFMDYALYNVNKYNENRKTINIGIKWLFWRCKKNNVNEIFTIAFIHEVISILLFIAVTIVFVVALVLNEQLLMYISIVPLFIYLIYCAVKLRTIEKITKADIN